MGPRAENWLSCHHSAAHKGAGVTASVWLGARPLFVTGDDSGKLGVWKVINEGEGSDGEFRLKGPAKAKDKDKEKEKADQEAYAAKFASVLAANANAELKNRFSAEELERLLPEGTDIAAAVQVNPDVFFAASHISMQGHEASGNILFTITQPTTARVTAIYAACESADVAKQLNLTPDPRSHAVVRSKKLKCVGFNREHTAHMKITHLVASRTGDVLFSAGIDGCVKVWEVSRNTADLTLVRSLLFPQPVYSIACTDRGDLLTATCGDHIRVIDVPKLRHLPAVAEAGRLKGHNLPALVGSQLGCNGITVPTVSSSELRGEFSLSQTQRRDLTYHCKAVRVAVSSDGSRVDALFRIGQKPHKLHLLTFAVQDGSLERSVVMTRLSQDTHLERLGDHAYVACSEGFIFRVKDPVPGDTPFQKEADVFEQIASTRLRITSLSLHPLAGFCIVTSLDRRTNLLPFSSSAAQQCTSVSQCLPSVSHTATSRTGEYTLLGSSDGSLSVLMHQTEPVIIRDEETVFSLTDPETSNGIEAMPSQEFPDLTQFNGHGDGPQMTSQQLGLNRMDSQPQLLMGDDSFVLPSQSQFEGGGMRRLDSDLATVLGGPAGGAVKRKRDDTDLAGPDAKK